MGRLDFGRKIRREYFDKKRLRTHMRQVAQELLEEEWVLRNDWEPRGIPVIHPDEYRRWLKNGPCPGCPCEEWCDRICRLRARWWDDFRRELRRG